VVLRFKDWGLSETNLKLAYEAVAPHKINAHVSKFSLIDSIKLRLKLYDLDSRNALKNGKLGFKIIYAISY
jgi:hypothetical protein